MSVQIKCTSSRRTVPTIVILLCPRIATYSRRSLEPSVECAGPYMYDYTAALLFEFQYSRLVKAGCQAMMMTVAVGEHDMKAMRPLAGSFSEVGTVRSAQHVWGAPSSVLLSPFGLYDLLPG